MSSEDDETTGQHDKPTMEVAPREMTPDLPPARAPRRRSTNRGPGYDDPPIVPLELFAVGVSGRVRRDPHRPA
ncbi:hypothetical protein AB0J90_28350 [Micromonospora sp. NPDC049523]|uniref:hypothetical protein n=1 Tax=Micromonospora sp. NPDC049523 TaxID=3155921 RepID=UPI00341A08F3